MLLRIVLIGKITVMITQKSEKFVEKRVMYAMKKVTYIFEYDDLNDFS